jgi:hypothetical protein
MDRIAGERRAANRYDLHFPLHYRVSQKGALVRFGTGMTCELSATGLSFRCRKPLPVGAHIEIMVDWPAKYGDIYPIALQITGFILRSDGSRTAVRLTSRKFRVDAVHAEPVRASA